MRFISIFFLVVYSFPVICQSDSEGQRKLDPDPVITQQFMVLSCPADSLNVGDMRLMNDEAFSAIDGEYLYDGYKEKDIWLKTTLARKGNQQQNIIVLDFLRLYLAEVYIDTVSVPSFVLGDRVAPKDRAYSSWIPAFQVDFHGKEKLDLYIRVKNGGNYLLLSVLQLSEKNFINFQLNRVLGLTIYYGGILIILIFNLLLFFRYKNAVILFYFFYVLLFLLMQLMRDGLGLYLWYYESINGHARIITILISLTLISNCLFAYRFLNIPSISKTLRQLFYALIGVCFVLMFFALIDQESRIYLKANRFTAILSTLLILVSGYMAYKNEKDEGNKIILKYYFFAYFILTLGVLSTILAASGVLQHPVFDVSILKITFLIEVIMLTLGLFRYYENMNAKRFIEMQISIEKSKKEKAEISTRLIQSEMKALLSQMKPHFVFNSLNSIQNLIWKDDKKEAQKYILLFSKLMRRNLDDAGKNLIDLNAELNAIDTYVDLEKRRIDKTVDFIKHIEVKHHREVLMIPPFLIQPLIENSFWHGINNHQIDIGIIELFIEQLGNEILIRVTDNGVGLGKSHPAKNREGDSKSQHITIERLLLFEKSQGYKSRFKIYNREEEGKRGTTVQFYLPVILKNKG